MSGCIITGLKVFPSYGKSICRLIWNTSMAFGGNPLEVWKSRDGYTDWYKCGDVGTSISGTFTDIEFLNRNDVFNWHYKLRVMSQDGTSIIEETPSVGIYDDISKEDFAYLRSMLSNEVLTKDNLDIFLCRPLGRCGNPDINPSLSPNVNIMTGDIVGRATDTTSFGKYYQSGYSQPIKTFITILQLTNRHVDDQQGSGYSTQHFVQFSSVSYPKWIVGDMVVDLKTDQRWLYDGQESETRFKGMYPFTFTGILRLLPRNSIEYSYDLRQILEDGGCL